VVDDAADKVGEGANGGTDSVTSTITYTLGSNLENLSLGNADGIDGTGNSLANLIGGGNGDNVLSGLAANDALEGNAGDDLLLGGDVLDIGDLLTGFDAVTSDINDFVQAVESNGSTTIRVDTNGGGNSFVDMAVLEGVNTDVMGLLNNGSLALAD